MPLRRLPSAVTVALILALALAGAALAGLQPNVFTQKSATNPQPAQDDIVLPMPCDLTMAFRAVEIPAQGFLWDRDLIMGCDDCNRPGMEYYERRFPAAISGPFTESDLPKDWRDALPPGGGVRHNYYLIGKYEVSTLQWRAIMDGSCPAGPVTAADVQPKADVSWFEAVDFSRRYTEWLLENARDKLPCYRNDPKNVGYLRLPTEAEWEYAARGGAKVPAETLQQEDFFPLAPDTHIADYAAYRGEGAVRILEAPQPIGKLRPNPLGLYDTAGNVAEIVLDPFHFSIGGRLHGSAGGFLRKGGGFANSEGEIKPGRREEVAFFTERGAARARDLGLRLVLSGIDTPDGGRRQELMEEWKRLGEQGSVRVQGEPPLKAMERLLATVKDPALKDNLGRLRDLIKDNQVKLEKLDSDNVEGLIRTAAYIIEALRSYAVRNALAVQERDKARKNLDELRAKGQTGGERFKFEEEGVAKFEEARRSFVDAIVSILNFYKMQLAEIGKYGPELIATKLAVIKAEYASGGGGFTKNMSSNLAVIEKHLRLARNNKSDALTKPRILDDVLNKALREGIKLP